VHEHFPFCFLAYVDGFSFVFFLLDCWIVDFSGKLTATLAYYLWGNVALFELTVGGELNSGFH